MREFGQKFLTEDPRRLGQAIFVAGFGKHPGWDDHIEDIGIETESLAIAKHLLYIDGIGGQINTGAWDRLGQDGQLSSFKHLFTWERGGQLLIGQVWSSMDGKGRTRYPMIACAQCVGLPLRWVMDYVAPRLKELQESCRATRLARDVRAAFQRVQTDLRAQCRRGSRERSVPDLGTDDRKQFLARPELGTNQEGLYRILYQVRSQMGVYAPGQRAHRDNHSESLSRRLRVPTCADAPRQAVLLWSKLFASQLSPAAPRLLMIPDDEPWLDFVVGELSSQDCFCLRASLKVLPLASEVPYNLEPQFRQQAKEFISAFERGVDSPARRHRVGVWMAVISLLVLVVTLVVAYPWLVERWPQLGEVVNRLHSLVGGQ